MAVIAFDDVRLPVDIEQGAVGGPSWNTGVVTMANGEEQRTQNWQVPRHSYQIEYGTSETDWQPVRDFFYARRGRARGFRFKDWTDYIVYNQPINLTGPTQLARTYTDINNVTFNRNITRVVQGTIILSDNTGSIVDRNGVAYSTGFTESYGTLTPVANSPVVMPTGGLTAYFEFDVPVRFDSDLIALTADTVLAASVGTINLIELIENSATLNGG